MNRSEFIENKPAVAEVIHSEDFVWKNQMNTSFCHLKVYQLGRKKFAVATEPKVNTGASVTNGAEALWLGVFLKYGDMKSFETYDGKNFDGVEIRNGNASWYAVGSWDKVLEECK